jgi:hypothetical protein
MLLKSEIIVALEKYRLMCYCPSQNVEENPHKSLQLSGKCTECRGEHTVHTMHIKIK